MTAKITIFTPLFFLLQLLKIFNGDKKLAEVTKIDCYFDIRL